MNDTATKISAQNRDEEYLNRAIADFIDKYRPISPHQAVDFDVELHHLMRLVYAEAAKPYQRQMDRMLECLPMALNIPKAEKP